MFHCKNATERRWEKVETLDSFFDFLKKDMVDATVKLKPKYYFTLRSTQFDS